MMSNRRIDVGTSYGSWNDLNASNSVDLRI